MARRGKSGVERIDRERENGSQGVARRGKTDVERRIERKHSREEGVRRE